MPYVAVTGCVDLVLGLVVVLLTPAPNLNSPSGKRPPNTSGAQVLMYDVLAKKRHTRGLRCARSLLQAQVDAMLAWPRSCLTAVRMPRPRHARSLRDCPHSVAPLESVPQDISINCSGDILLTCLEVLPPSQCRTSDLAAPDSRQGHRAGRVMQADCHTVLPPGRRTRSASSASAPSRPLATARADGLPRQPSRTASSGPCSPSAAPS